MLRRTFVTSLLPLGLGSCVSSCTHTEPEPTLPVSGARTEPLRARALAAMKRATRFVTETLAFRGGYVWSYLPDLSRSWGELEARRSMLWLQPPGTPAMGHLFLDAFHATGDELYASAASDVAGALIAAQHASGGWNYVYDFAGPASLQAWYESIGKNAWRLEEFHRFYDNSTFDDACTASATQFLLRLSLERPSRELARALTNALGLLRQSQYPSGGWPQRYPPAEDYTALLTFNDDVLGENIKSLVMMHLCVPGANVREHIQAAMASVFTLQQPAPQAGWGLQHSLGGKPAAARTFEPQALATHTTANNVRQLLSYYALTADDKYLSRVPEALDWLDKTQLPAELAHERGGTHPTFIELGSGDPLYVHRRGSNVVNGRYYTDKTFAPRLAHYSPVRTLDLAALHQRFADLRARPKAELLEHSPLAPLANSRAGQLLLPRFFSPREPELEDLRLGAEPHRPQATEQGVLALVESLDAAGRWLAPLPLLSNPYRGPGSAEPYLEDTYASTRVGDRSDTSPYDPSDAPRSYPREEAPLGISLRTFIQNMAVLLAYVASSA